MSDDAGLDATATLGPLDGTDPGTVAAMAAPLYRELRSLAEAYLRQERPDHTLQATALVHEAYLRLADVSPGSAALGRTASPLPGRVAARISMRRILDQPRARPEAGCPQARRQAQAS